MKQFKVIIKERNNPSPVETVYSGPDTTTKMSVAKFFGCYESDVEYFTINEIK